MTLSVNSRTPVNRRRYKRYIVTGPLAVQGPGGESRGTLLNVGQGGILVRSDTTFKEGADLSLTFQVAGYPETFAVQGRVVGTKADVLAFKFLTEPSGLDMLVRWLDLQHVAWSSVE